MPVLNFVKTKMRIEKGKQTFQQTGPKVWNELPDFIRRSQSRKNEKNYFRLRSSLIFPFLFSLEQSILFY